MMPDYGSLIVAVRANTSQLRSDISTASAKIGDDAGKTIGSRISGGLSTVVKGAGLATIAAGAVGAAKAVAFTKSAVVDFNSTLQQSTIAFTTMLGSGKKARSFVGELQQFAAKTPFEFQGLVGNAQSMMGMGVSAKDVLPDLKALGDSVASVGGGADVLNNTISAFGQTMAKGTLDMGNMNQLLQGGIPNALKILAAHYKVTTGEMVKMISSGKVQSSEALPALVKGIEKGTSATAALGGMMDKQSKTFQGSLSNISDSLTQTIAKVGKPLFNALSGIVGRLATFLGSKQFSRIGRTVTRVLSSAFAKVGPAIAKVMPFLRTMAKMVGGVLVDAWHSLPAVINVVKALWPALVAGAKLLGGAFKGLIGLLHIALKAFRWIGDEAAKHPKLFRDIVAAIVAVVGAYKLWKTATEIMVGVQAAIKGVALATDASKLSTLAWNAVAKIQLVWANAQRLAALAGAAAQWVMNNAMIAFPAMAIVAGVILIITHWKQFQKIVGIAVHAIATGAKWLWHKILEPAFHAVVTAIKDVGKAFTALGQVPHWVYVHVIKPIIDWFGKLPGRLKDLAGQAIDWLRNGITKAASGIASWAWGKVIQPVLDWFGKLPDRLMTLAGNAIEGFKRGIVQIASGIGQWAWDHVIAPILDFFGHLYDLASSYGGSLIRGLKDGILNIIGDIGGWINDHLVQPIVKAVKKFFHISSPSKVMAGLGKSVIQGFLSGLFTKFPLDIAKTLFGSLPNALAAIVKKGLAVLTRLPVAAWHALEGVAGGIKGLFGSSTALTSQLLAKLPPDVIAKLGLGAVTGNFGGSPQGVWSALLAAGFSPVQAAGIMGNIQTESGFNPNIVQGGGNSLDPSAAGGGGYGLVQWTPGSKLIPYLHGQTPTVANEISALVAQLRGEGPSPESAAGAALRGARNPYEAGLIFGLQYERFSTSTAYSRAAQADEWYRRFANGNSKYDNGGLLPVGASLAMNTSHRPEPVLTGAQWDALTGAASRGHGPLVVTGGRLHVEPDDQGRLRGWVQDIVMEEADLASLTARMGRGSW